MADLDQTPVSAFAVYAKMRKSLESVVPSRKTKKRQSLHLDSTPNKPRKRSASVGDLTPNEKRKKSVKIIQPLGEKNMKRATPGKANENTPNKLNAKKLFNSPVDPVIKLATPKTPKNQPGDTPEIYQNGHSADSKSVKKLKSEENKVEVKVKTPKSSSKKSREAKSINSDKKKKITKKILTDGKQSKPPSPSPEIIRPSISSNLENGEDGCVSSIEEGKQLFEWLISPVELDTFYKANWESSPMYIKRSTPEYYKHITSTALIDSVLRNYYLQYTKNVDITSYSNGQRETHNPIGRALPGVVWDYYLNGCSVRLLNPQTFMPKLHMLNATLQEYFGCFVGANSYLTPPNSQGFAPHYDDIEAFILQIEGKKRWRLYKPRTVDEFLPRLSSVNFDQSEIGDPIMDIILEAGDLLYFPRGTIHQGETIDDTHSLHVTLSVYQKNSWGDFLEKLLPDALEKAIATNIEFREGLPFNYLQHVGLTYSDTDSAIKTEFIKKTKYLLANLVDYIDVDNAADEMAKKHIHDFLPPVLKEQEKECSVFENGERMLKNGEIVNRVEIEPDTRVRLVRAQCARLVQENDSLKLYYSNENSKEYHELELQYLEVTPEIAPAIEDIILRYPDFVKVEDLPIEEEDSKIQVVKDLWEKGILITDEPLDVIE